MGRRPHHDYTPAQERAIYLRGVRLFNAGEFFEAHEVWEDVWWEAAGSRRLFYQGLIQMTVAFEHWRRGNPAGAVKLYRSALGKFEQAPDRCLGLDCRALQARFERAMQPLLARAPNDRYGVKLNRARLFTIEPEDEPAEG